MENYIYVLHCNENKIYIGITYDIIRRLNDHLIGRGPNFTKKYRPKRLIHLFKCSDNEFMKGYHYENMFTWYYQQYFGLNAYGGQPVYYKNHKLGKIKKLTGTSFEKIEKQFIKIHKDTLLPSMYNCHKVDNSHLRGGRFKIKTMPEQVEYCFFKNYMELVLASNYLLKSKFYKINNIEVYHIEPYCNCMYCKSYTKNQIQADYNHVNIKYIQTIKH